MAYGTLPLKKRESYNVLKIKITPLLIKEECRDQSVRTGWFLFYETASKGFQDRLI
jgi:hypothetical protein